MSAAHTPPWRTVLLQSLFVCFCGSRRPFLQGRDGEDSGRAQISGCSVRQEVRLKHAVQTRYSTGRAAAEAFPVEVPVVQSKTTERSVSWVSGFDCCTLFCSSTRKNVKRCPPEGGRALLVLMSSDSWHLILNYLKRKKKKKMVRFKNFNDFYSIKMFSWVPAQNSVC